MTKELKHIPNLRFHEFIKLEDWEKKKIESITSQESSTMAMNRLEFQKEGFPVYGADGVIGYINDFQHEEEYISMVKDGSGVGKLNLCQEHSSILGTLTAIKSKDSKKYFLKWIYYLLNTLDFSSYVKGAGIPHIYYSDIKYKDIYVPSFLEQKKIAECLFSLDDYINATQEKIELLQAHKKGLMQQLLPAFGKIMPQKRLSKFEKTKEWNQVRLKDIATSFTGGTPNVLNKDFYNGDIPFIRSGEINKSKTELFLSNLALQNSSAKRIIRGTILYALYGATSGDVAISQIDGAINQAILAIIPNNKVNYLFLFYILEHQKESIKSKFLQGGQGNLSGQIIKNLSLSFPCLSEQREIAECFTSIDDLIDSTKQKFVMLQNHKRGLMQQLFPII